LWSLLIVQLYRPGDCMLRQGIQPFRKNQHSRVLVTQNSSETSNKFYVPGFRSNLKLGWPYRSHLILR
jgi:hypothetical protein